MQIKDIEDHGKQHAESNALVKKNDYDSKKRLWITAERSNKLKNLMQEINYSDLT